MVQALLNLADRTLGRALPQRSVEASCECPAGSSSWCSGSTLYTEYCCSWNCAAPPSCVVYAIIGGC